MKTLIIESFYSGSHKLWADNLKRTLGPETELMTLPGKYWKWRMHGAAVTFAQRVNRITAIPEKFIVSSLIDLAVFKALLDYRFREAELVLYMHENQISYPRPDDERLTTDHHYGFINYTSALAADRILFNSHFHLSSFIQALPAFLKMYPDARNLDTLQGLEEKCSVYYIPLDLGSFSSTGHEVSTAPTLLWNHRWEYDKGPKEFFETLISLAHEGLDFRLAVLGESYARAPEIFEIVKHELDDRIIHWGYAEDRAAYARIVRSAHILPVTTSQEFFGISVVEAIAAGCVPLLPDRLSYPELLGQSFDHYLYGEGQFRTRLKSLIASHPYDADLVKSIHRFHSFD